LSPCLLVILCSFLFLYRLGDRGLSRSHEARATQNAQSILSEDDWLLPQLFDRRVELQKPPLYYWLVAVLAGLGGGQVDAWAVRLPAALAGLVTVLAVYFLCRIRGRPLAGFVAAAGLATCGHFTWLARVGRIDMPLTCAVTVAVAGFYLGRCRVRENAGWGARLWFLLAYLAIAAGLLLKGPIALVLPAVVVLVFLLLEAAQPALVRAEGAIPTAVWWRWIHGFGLWWGVPLVLLVAGPWFVLANLETRGDFFRVFFWHHNLDRGFGVEGELHARPWWFYGPRLAADLFPWSLAVPTAMWLFGRGGGWRKDPVARLGLAWFASVLLLLSCLSFKRADYLLPAYPGVALFLGCVAEGWWKDQHAGGRLWLASCFVLVLGACAAGWWVYTDRAAQSVDRPVEYFAAAVRARTSRAVVFFRVEDHELAVHVGRPIDSVVEWENLDAWLARPGPVYVIMPAACAREWRQHLKSGRLEEVLRDSDLTTAPPARPLVLLCRPPGKDAARRRS
jgi:4-amino-4-deoxy-L-arabinose transferase-like glycosyltransferase